MKKRALVVAVAGAALAVTLASSAPAQAQAPAKWNITTTRDANGIRTTCWDQGDPLGYVVHVCQASTEPSLW